MTVLGNIIPNSAGMLKAGLSVSVLQWNGLYRWCEPSLCGSLGSHFARLAPATQAGPASRKLVLNEQKSKTKYEPGRDGL